MNLFDIVGTAIQRQGYLMQQRKLLKLFGSGMFFSSIGFYSFVLIGFCFAAYIHILMYNLDWFFLLFCSFIFLLPISSFLQESGAVRKEMDLGDLYDSISGKGFSARQKRSVVSNKSEVSYPRYFARFRRAPALESVSSEEWCWIWDCTFSKFLM